MIVEEFKIIVDLVVGIENLFILVVVVQVGGLVEIFSGDGFFIVFVFIDEVFVVFFEGLLEDLLKLENKDKLVSILIYYVVGVKVMFIDLLDGQKVVIV